MIIMPDGAEETKAGSAEKKPSRLKFWHRRAGEAMGHAEAWNDLDFGLFWIVSLLLFFLKMGVWPLAVWAVVWFAIKTWREK